ncbi:MAG: glycosyltransferase, partial [Actinobacteria bacterium]|nr:glycosyltransferase [Actinomycetota bacterium]
LAAERLRGRSISMVIRGGIEPHALEVLHNAHTRGLKIVDLRLPEKTSEAIAAFNQAPRADIYNVLSFMTDDIISLFYAAADAVLANSGHEPFGLVGLEVMAAGGMAFVGSTGEDYAIPWLNGVVLDSDDPAEICVALQHLREQPQARAQMRREAKATAENYTWKKIVEDALLQKLKYTAVRQDVRVASWPLLGSIAYEHGTTPAGKTPGTAC